jgi:hypothetical protein
VAAVVAAEKQEAALAEPKVIESGRRGQPVGAVSCDFNIWLGRPLNEGLVAEQLQAMNRPYRILPPGSMMTMDYSPSRVNFELDENGVVKRIFCG